MQLDQLPLRCALHTCPVPAAALQAFGFFFCKRTNTTITVKETTAAGTKDVDYEVR